MKHLLLLLACWLVVPLAGAQAPGDEEPWVETIEASRVIVNWNPRGQRLGTLLVYPCARCEMLTLSIDRDTRLTRLGEPVEISTLARKADWSAHVTRASHAPGRALAIAIFD
jgi:hypothetical protein